MAVTILSRNYTFPPFPSHLHYPFTSHLQVPHSLPTSTFYICFPFSLPISFPSFNAHFLFLHSLPLSLPKSNFFNFTMDGSRPTENSLNDLINLYEFIVLYFELNSRRQPYKIFS